MIFLLCIADKSDALKYVAYPQYLDWNLYPADLLCHFEYLSATNIPATFAGQHLMTTFI